MKEISKKLLAVALAAIMTVPMFAVSATANEDEVYEDWYLDELYNQGLYDEIPDYYWEENIYCNDSYEEDYWYEVLTVDNIVYEISYCENEVYAYIVDYERGENEESLVSETVVIPETVEYNGIEFPVAGIGYYAFADCHTLKEITLPESITTISDGAFSGAANLEKIVVPETVEFDYFGIEVFDKTPVLNYLAENSKDGAVILGQNVLLAYLGNEKTYIMPIEIDYIADHCFFMSGIQEVVFNSSITEIPAYAFASCRNLKEITIPHNIVSIGEGAFSNCSNLEKVTLSDGLEYIELKAFEGTKIKDIYIGASVCNVIGAFVGCNTLENITISEDNTNYVFEDDILYYFEYYEDEDGNQYTSISIEYFLITSDKTSVKIPEEVYSIASYAFYNCKQLDEVVINSPLGVYDYAFTYCEFESFDFSNVSDIGFAAFKGCKNLTEADLSEVYFIDDSAFENCTKLENVEFGLMLYVIGAKAFANTALKDVIIYGDMCEVYENAFANCKNLKSVEFSACVGAIYENIFIGCTSLERVFISKTVDYVDYNAFRECEDVTFEIIKHSVSGDAIVEFAEDPDNDVTKYEFVGKISFLERVEIFFSDIFSKIYDFFFGWIDSIMMF